MISLSSIIEHKEEKIKAIVDRVCEWHGLLPTTIYETNRQRDLVEARQEAWYFLRKHIRSSGGKKVSLTELGCVAKYWNIDIQWDHATVLHACNSIEGRRDVDKLFDKLMTERDDVFKSMMEHYQYLESNDGAKRPTLHYFEMLGYLTYNLSLRNDTTEIDYLIDKLTDRRVKHEADQNPSENIEMEMVQGTTD